MIRAIAVTVLFCVLVSDLAHAQNNPAPPSRTPRFDVGVTGAATATSPIVKYCCGLRTPPSFQQIDQSQAALLLGLDLRVHETRRTSTVLEVGWGAAFEYVESYPRPASIEPIFTTYAAERHVRTCPSLDVSVMQELEFPTRPHVQPWVAAGLLLSRMSADQMTVSVGFNDPAVRIINNDNWEFTRWGFTVAGGVTLRPTRHVFVDASGAVRSLNAIDRTDADRSTRSVPHDNSPVVRVSLGISFW
jgi:opacity protein-like surface antigen